MPDAMSENNLKILANWMIPYLRKTLLYKLETWPKSGSGMRGRESREKTNLNCSANSDDLATASEKSTVWQL